jgi:4-amino-4-deoxy-L-arabinose transferase-like glycosyltransferase
MAERDDGLKDTKHYTVVLEQLGLAAVKVTIWLLLATGICYYFWWRYVERPGLASPEAFEYGQIARNNLRGEWFRTEVIRPVDLWLNRAVEAHPDLHHSPAYSIVLAGLMAINGATTQTLLWGSELFLFLLLPMLYFPSRALFGRRVARLGLFFCLIMPAVGRAAVSGTPGLLATFLITALFGTLSVIRERRYLVTALAGLVLGACALTATRYIFLVVPAAGYLVLTLHRRAWLHAPILVAVAALVVLPWALRNARLSGSPWPPMEWISSYQLAAESQQRTGADVPPALAAPHAIERSFSPETLQVALRGRESTRSVFRGLRLGVSDLFRYGAQSVLVVLFLAGILIRSKNRQAEWLRVALYVAIGIDLVYGSFVRPDGFLLLPYLPFMMVVGAFVLVELISRLGYTRALSSYALVVVVILVAIGQMVISTNPADALTKADQDRHTTTWYLENLFPEVLEPDTVVLSNVPWHTAWYLDRPSIWLPPEYEDLMRLRMQADQPITFAFLAGYALDRNEPSYEVWERGFRESRMPDSFGLAPFFSTMFSPRWHVCSSFMSPERIKALIEEKRKARDTKEPSGASPRPSNEEMPEKPN